MMYPRRLLNKKVAPKRKKEHMASETDVPQRLAELVTLSALLQSRPIETCQHELAALLSRVQYLGAGQAGFVFEEQVHVPQQAEEAENTLVAVKQIPVRRPEQVDVLLREISANVRANELVQFGVSPNFVLLFAAFVCNPACDESDPATSFQTQQKATLRNDRIITEQHKAIRR